MLADFTESPFFGNEWASAGLIGGAVGHRAERLVARLRFRTLAEILTAQALAAAIGVVVWRRQWIAKGWYPTYIPVVSVAPAAVLAYGGTATAIVGGALLGALLGPPLPRRFLAVCPRIFILMWAMCCQWRSVHC